MWLLLTECMMLTMLTAVEVMVVEEVLQENDPEVRSTCDAARHLRCYPLVVACWAEHLRLHCPVTDPAPSTVGSVQERREGARVLHVLAEVPPFEEGLLCRGAR